MAIRVVTIIKFETQYPYQGKYLILNATLDTTGVKHDKNLKGVKNISINMKKMQKYSFQFQNMSSSLNIANRW